MIPTQQLEADLRTMLRNRADSDIRSAPAFDRDARPGAEDLTALTAVRLPSRRPPTWLAVAAAVVVLTTVAASLLGVRYLRRHDGPAPTATLRTPQCTVAVPSAWTNAVSAGRVPVSATSITVLGVDPDGTTLVSWTRAGHPEVALIAPDRSVTTVLRMANPGTDSVLGGGIEGRWATVTVRRSTGAQLASAVYIVDRNTDQTRLIRDFDRSTDAPLGTSAAFLRDGHVYWAEGVSPTASIKDYDTATATVQTLDSGDVGDLVSTLGAGILWRHAGASAQTAYRAAQLPAPVRTAINRSTGTGTSAGSFDGSGYAWSQNLGPTSADIVTWRPGQPKAVVVHTERFDHGSNLYFGGVGIAGPYVAWGTPMQQPTTQQVLDTRTGAVIALNPAVSIQAMGATVTLATDTTVSTLPIATLPQLHC